MYIAFLVQAWVNPILKWIRYGAPCTKIAVENVITAQYCSSGVVVHIQLYDKHRYFSLSACYGNISASCTDHSMLGWYGQPWHNGWSRDTDFDRNLVLD